VTTDFSLFTVSIKFTTTHSSAFGYNLLFYVTQYGMYKNESQNVSQSTEGPKGMQIVTQLVLAVYKNSSSLQEVIPHYKNYHT